MKIQPIKFQSPVKPNKPKQPITSFKSPLGLAATAAVIAAEAFAISCESGRKVK